MNPWAKRMGAVLALSLGAGLVSASPAFAINATSCGSRDDFVKITWKVDYPGGSLNVSSCWANAGGIVEYQTNVQMVCSGNNAGYYSYTSNGNYYTWYFNKWECLSFVGGVNSDYLQIY